VVGMSKRKFGPTKVENLARALNGRRRGEKKTTVVVRVLEEPGLMTVTIGAEKGEIVLKRKERADSREYNKRNRHT